MINDFHTLPLVQPRKIIGTNMLVYSVWEPYKFSAPPIYGSHSTYTTIDGVRMGRIGTRRLTPELDALPPNTDERIEAVQAFHAAQYEFAYAAIIAAFPDAANGRRSMGEITVTEAVS